MEMLSRIRTFFMRNPNWIKQLTGKKKTHLCYKCRGRMKQPNVFAKRRSLKCVRCGRVLMKIGKSRYI